MNPLQVIKSSIPLLAGLFTLSGTVDGATAAGKPNIILIYSDDHGFADLGVQGVDKDIRTPNLDALAKDGVRFVRGYVSAPQCVPSRAGVMTGRYQQRFGVEDNTMGPLPLEELTIAERLKAAGYVSCQVGKWHLEPPPKRGNSKEGAKGAGKEAQAFLPLHQGFDEYCTGQMESFVASHDLKGNKLPNAPQTLKDKRFRCVWQADAAVSFIDRHAHDPFFLYLAFFAPHVPLESPEPWFSKTPKTLPLERRQALAMIAAMDEGIGRIRAKLREQGNEKNTIIFFIGDNGAPLKEHAWDGSLNLPLVGEKGMLTDGGTRTPFLATWPGTFPAGMVYEKPVINLDVAATAVAIAGLPHDDKLDGVNLLPYVNGQKTENPHEALFWRWRSQAAIRMDHWKLIHVGPEERYLFDLNAPEGQSELAKNNLISKFPEVAADLEKRLMKWNASLPAPGLPRPMVAEDEKFYDAHVRLTTPTVPIAVEKPGPGKIPAKDSPAPASNGKDWVARNATASIKDGALHIEPEEKSAQHPIMIFSKLKIPSAVGASANIRTEHGGKIGIAWRLDGQQDFPPDQMVMQDIAGSPEFQNVALKIPAKGSIIHFRLILPAGTSDLRQLEIKTSDGAHSKVWSFTK